MVGTPYPVLPTLYLLIGGTLTSDNLALSRHLLEIAATAALKVGDYILAPFHQGVVAQEKAGNYDLVTEYDHRSEEMIAEHIFRLHPDSTLIGEEGGRQGNGSVQWYVDPIDGTNNFADGFPFFCVSIAAAAHGQMVAGVVFDPLRRELFTASLKGAFLNGERLRSTGHASDAKALVSTNCPNSGGRSPQADFDLFQKLVDKFHSVRRLGSLALELSYVACGRVDVTFGLRANPWDVGAGMLLVQQAGGRYIGVRTDESPDGLKPWLCHTFIASCPEFDLEHSVIREVLERGVPVTSKQ